MEGLGFFFSEDNRVKAIESLGDKVFDKALEIDADETVQVGTGEKRKRDNLDDDAEEQMSATERMKKRFIFNNQKSSTIFSTPLTQPTASPAAKIREMVATEIRKYLLEDFPTCNTLSYWKAFSKENDNCVKKALADCALKYLTPTVSTVNVERLFSTAGDIVTDERNRLKPENASKILLTRESLPIINFRYDD